MSKNHFDELKSEIKRLNVEIDGKDFENELLQNEIAETVKPSVAIANQTSIIIEMLMELNLFAKKNGWTEKANISKSRLNRLLQCNGELFDMANTNNQLKALNRELHSQYQLLRVDNMKLRETVKKMTDAFNGL